MHGPGNDRRHQIPGDDLLLLDHWSRRGTPHWLQANAVATPQRAATDRQDSDNNDGNQSFHAWDPMCMDVPVAVRTRMRHCDRAHTRYIAASAHSAQVNTMRIGTFAMILATAGTLAAAKPAFPPKVALATIQQAGDERAKAHPRLLANAEQLAALRTIKDRGPLAAGLADAVVREAKAMLEIPPITRKQQGRRLLGQSRRCLKRTTTLATAYHITGDAAFATRCEQEMVAVAAFRDWNPSHYLDVGEMTLALAIGYDWLYDQLDPEARKTIRDAILDKGVRVPWENPKHARWQKASNNWGQVCHAGMVAGALVTWEDDPELAAKTVDNALRNVVRSMRAFAPKGSYPEGPGYWVYGTSFNVVLIASLEGFFGTDFGLDLAPGFRTTAEFIVQVYGPSGQFFNYADGGSRRSPSPAMQWFAKRYQRPDWLLNEDDILRARLPRIGTPKNADGGGDRLLALALLWMAPEVKEVEVKLPLHWSSEGHVPITIHRTSWTDPNATFIGLKAGSPSAPHGHMDAGSFVLDADGVRWAIDLGAESYHGIESRGMTLWRSAQDSDRWTIFRQSNASHNTLLIDGALQHAKGKAKIIGFADTGDFPHSVADLSEVYKGQVKTAIRGVAMLPSGEVLIQDHLTGLKPGASVRWGFVTKGKPDSLEGASVTLRDGKASLLASRLGPAETEWETYETEKPRNEWDSPNKGTRMLGFKATAPASGELTLAVVLTPGSRLAQSQIDTIKLRNPETW